MVAARVPLTVVVAGAVACGALLFAAPRTGDVALYNGTPSMPVGVYLRTFASIEPGAIVTVRATDVAPDYAAARSFTKPGNRFLKRIAATTGDVVCAYGPNVWINGEALPARQSQDGSGRTLPRWSGCLTARFCCSGKHRTVLTGATGVQRPFQDRGRLAACGRLTG